MPGSNLGLSLVHTFKANVLSLCNHSSSLEILSPQVLGSPKPAQTYRRLLGLHMVVDVMQVIKLHPRSMCSLGLCVIAVSYMSLTYTWRLRWGSPFLKCGLNYFPAFLLVYVLGLSLPSEKPSFSLELLTLFLFPFITSSGPHNKIYFYFKNF